ncbi:MAG: tyrosine-type recombinase/integrase [Ruminococcus sp.]|nr:tyrosine-type recombinase/integrase [Ruminococcus sp.]
MFIRKICAAIFSDCYSTGTLGEWCKKIGEMIGVPQLHSHDWRHTQSQLYSLAGMPLEDISALLNHSGTDVTRKHYLKTDTRRLTQLKDELDM